MEPDARINVHVEFDGFITKYELAAIIGAIDYVIEDYIASTLAERSPEFNYPSSQRRESELSYVGITGVAPGSITLFAAIGMPVVHYVSRHFRRGLAKSALTQELERSGLLVGNIVAQRLLGPINDRLQRYVERQRRSGGNLKSVTVTHN